MLKIGSKETKIAAALIVKNEVDLLDKCLGSLPKCIDEIVVAWTGNNPDTKNILAKYNCHIYPFEWTDNFSEARNFSFSKCDSDLILWIDSDDTLENGDKLEKVCQSFADPKIGMIWCGYKYDFDKNGNCVSLFWRERICRKGLFEWKGALHETLIQTTACTHIVDDSIYWVHHSNPQRIHEGAIRNLEIITAQYKKEHGENKVDPRTVFDLARSLRAFGFWDKAILAFQEFVNITGWDDDKALAYHWLAEAYRKQRQYDVALNMDLTTIKIKPLWPDGYLGLAETYFCLEDWDRVIHFTKLGLEQKPPLGIIPIDPTQYEAKPFLFLEWALSNQGRFKDALRAIRQAKRFYPTNEHIKEREEALIKGQEHMDIERAALRLRDYLLKNKEDHKLQNLVNAIPTCVEDHPIFVRLRNKYKPKNRNTSNTIAIWCGPTYQNWSPGSVKYGIGGSEEAVIHMSEELTKLGWVVNVYNTCDKEGEYNGVTYNNFWRFDKTSDTSNVFIAWRMPEFITQAPKESKKVLWLHDVQKPEYYSQEIINTVDKIMPLSKWHRTNIPSIPEDKFFYTRNGIVSNIFKANLMRNPFKCIYASSPDRGLDILLKLWPQIYTHYPKAELHVYYGFTKVYDELHRGDSGMMQFKEEILRQLNQAGVTYHGMVSHKELTESFLTAGLWLYPTYFTEISCITAMKAQAAGAIPITTNVAALEETVQYGIKIKKDIYTEAAQQEWVKVVLSYLNPETQEKQRDEMRKWACEQFDWSKVAEEWDKMFRRLK